MAACLRTYSAENISQGILKHLNIQLDNTGLFVPSETVLPLVAAGKYSDRNINGYEEVRRDLPKETHYNSIETPNWGDSSNGTHTVNMPYEKYPRDFYGPEYLHIKINAQNKNPDQKQYTLTFEVDRVLDKESPNFENELLKCLNILQENIGAFGVQKSGATLNDYLQTIKVAWEVLPPGTREETIERIFANRKSSSDDNIKIASERYDFFMKLLPKKLILGTSGLQRYFGAQIESDLVVFENIEYGNAIYIMFNDWQELSLRTRTELLSGRYGQNFERILHHSSWKNKVQDLVDLHRKK